MNTTTMFQAFRCFHESIAPHRLVPIGPDIHFLEPQDRAGRADDALVPGRPPRFR